MMNTKELKPKELFTNSSLASYKLPALSFSILIFIGQSAMLIVFGKFTLIDRIKNVDERILNSIVDLFQSNSIIISIAETATDLGKTQYNYYMAATIAAYILIKFKNILPAIIVFLSMYFLVMYQKVTSNLVDGSIPTEDVIGIAGPFFSGGVARVVLLTGLICITVFKIKPNNAYKIAILLGLFEGLTRLALARHWPLDIIGGLFAGLAILLLTSKLLEPWLSSKPKHNQTGSEPKSN